jgi:DNA polymerase-3 subunit delta
MPSLKPAYLIHGEDHGAVAERRVRLRALAQREGAACVESLESAKVGDLADALAAIPLAVGWRVIIVDGVERWKDAQVKERLVGALAEIPPQTTVALFACEQGSVKAPVTLHRAVTAAGGKVAHEAPLKRWELPRWAAARASAHGLALDRDAAEALVEQVGERRQRLARELEKLAIAAGAGAERGGEPRRVDVEDVRLLAAGSAQTQVFGLGDALLAGSAREALLVYARLRAQGERASGLLYLLAARLRQALSVAERLERGEPASAIRRTLRMPQRAAEQLIAHAGRAGPVRLRGALGALADLELFARGGPEVTALRPRGAALEEDTLMVRAIEAIATGAPLETDARV